MNQPICDSLEDYLAGELDSSARLAFESHLGLCAACKGEVHLQASIDRLLAIAQPSAPAQLQRNVAARIRRRRARRLARLAVAAAVLACCAASWILWTGDTTRTDASLTAGTKRRPMDVAPRETAPVIASGMNEPTTRAIADIDPSTSHESVIVDAGRSAIVVSRPSENPRIHIFWLYPTADVSLNRPGEITDPTQPERDPL